MTTKAYTNFSEVLTLSSAYKKDGRNLLSSDSDIIKNATIIFNDDEILWVGKNEERPKEYSTAIETDYSNKSCLPEVVDCHTHLIFGGDRAFEYVLRLNGADYEEIGNSGGGILNTMKGTNEATKEELYTIAKKRIEKLASYGVGTIDVKTGYGLNYEKEKELSEVVSKLKIEFHPKIQIINTYMAAHAVPKNFKSSAEYLDKVVIPLLHDLAKRELVDCVDIFHEQNYFDLDDTKKLFEVAKSLNLPFKSHADEFADNKGALLAATMGALSTDHLLMTGDDGVEALAKSNTVATLLPGTGFFLGKPQADARKFLDKGVKVAIGSDYNPGSCHCDNVILVASLAAPHYKMNVTELFSAITLNAASAVGLKDQGAIVKGLKPRFSIFNTNEIAKIPYSWGSNLFLD